VITDDERRSDDQISDASESEADRGVPSTDQHARGTTKLRSLCRDELGIEPDLSTAFLFVNSGHDTLLVYSIDPDGDRTLTKRIEKGAFIMPVPGPDGAPFTIVRPSILARMFRS